MVERRAFVDGAVHNKMPRGHRGDGCHLVAHEQDGGAFGKGTYYAVEVRLEMLVDVTQRLVEHQKVGTAYYGTAKERALELPAGEGADGASGVRAEFYGVEDLVDTPCPLAGREGAVGEQSGGHNLGDRHGKMRVDHVFLRQIAYGDVRADSDGSRGGLDKAQHYAQEGGFSPSVRAGYGHKVALCHRKVDIFENRAPLAPEAYATEGDYVSFW